MIIEGQRSAEQSKKISFLAGEEDVILNDDGELKLRSSIQPATRAKTCSHDRQAFV